MFAFEIDGHAVTLRGDNPIVASIEGYESYPTMIYPFINFAEYHTKFPPKLLFVDGEYVLSYIINHVPFIFHMKRTEKGYYEELKVRREELRELNKKIAYLQCFIPEYEYAELWFDVYQGLYITHPTLYAENFSIWSEQRRVDILYKYRTSIAYFVNEYDFDRLLSKFHLIKYANPDPYTELSDLPELLGDMFEYESMEKVAASPLHHIIYRSDDPLWGRLSLRGMLLISNIQAVCIARVKIPRFM